MSLGIASSVGAARIPFWFFVGFALLALAIGIAGYIAPERPASSESSSGTRSE